MFGAPAGEKGLLGDRPPAEPLPTLTTEVLGVETHPRSEADMLTQRVVPINASSRQGAAALPQPLLPLPPPPPPPPLTPPPPLPSQPQHYLHSHQPSHQLPPSPQQGMEQVSAPVLRMVLSLDQVAVAALLQRLIQQLEVAVGKAAMVATQAQARALGEGLLENGGTASVSATRLSANPLSATPPSAITLSATSPSPTPLSHQRSQWIFALAAAIEKPLHAEMSAAFR